MQRVDELDGVKLTHREAQLDDVRLHLVEAGEGPLVVLLHGFPDSWYSWRNQIPALVRAGFRVVAPDLRGYGGSDKPAGVDAYRTEKLAADVAGLIRASGERRAIVVGHDWGAAVAWAFASLYPGMLERLVILNGPHPRQMQTALLHPSQLLRSWYIGFFQLPLLPEALLRARDFAVLRRMLSAQAMRRGAITDEDVERAVEALRPAGALSGAVNYYRAAIRDALRGKQPPARQVEAPVLVVWGRKDPALVPALARPEARFAPNARVEMLEDAGHFVHQDAPARVNALLTEFLAPLARPARKKGRKSTPPPREAAH